MLIGIKNGSTLVSDDQAKKMCTAIDLQMRRDVSPSWGMLPPRVFFVSKNAYVPGCALLALVDDIPEAPDAEGYHFEEDDGKFVGNIGVKTIPGAVLTGRDSVASVVSHEVIELFIDPRVNLWADHTDGYSYPYEGCDAIQELYYSINGVSVSDFVLPSYFDMFGKEPFDHLGNLHAPFSLSSGGYTVRRKQGTGETELFGRRPDWKQAIRSSKRM